MTKQEMRIVCMDWFPEFLIKNFRIKGQEAIFEVIKKTIIKSKSNALEPKHQNLSFKL